MLKFLPGKTPTNHLFHGAVDIRIRLERDLIHWVMEAERARKKAESYFGFMIHDITNFLSPILSYGELLLAKSEQSGNREIIEKIVFNARKTASLIYYVRKYAEAQNVESDEIRPIDLREFLPYIESSIRKGYPNMRFNIAYHLANDDSIEIAGGEYILDILFSIFDNAIDLAYNEYINIEIFMTKRVNDRGDPFWEITVEDHGRGIPDEMKDVYVARFSNSDSLSRGIASSLSFGSAIAKHFGGELLIEDRIEGDFTQGCRIVLNMPAIEDEIE